MINKFLIDEVMNKNLMFLKSAEAEFRVVGEVEEEIFRGNMMT